MIAIIKYNAGNITSVEHAVKRLGLPCRVTDEIDEILCADKVIFPGVGEAKSAIKYLKDRELDEVIKSLLQPVLGICLGLQLMCRHSEEGDTPCMDIFDAAVKKFPALDIVPHMGWNKVRQTRSHPIWAGIPDDTHFYFVHSYYADPADPGLTVGETDYGVTFTCAVAAANIFAVQFHPEKSAEHGLRLYRNFVDWQP